MPKKRTVGMTLRLTVEEHKRYHDAMAEMGFKHFTDICREGIEQLIGNTELFRHHKAQVAEIERVETRLREVLSNNDVLEARIEHIKQCYAEVNQSLHDDIERLNSDLQNAHSSHAQVQQNLADKCADLEKLVKAENEKWERANASANEGWRIANMPLLKLWWNRFRSS